MWQIVESLFCKCHRQEVLRVGEIDILTYWHITMQSVEEVNAKLLVGLEVLCYSQTLIFQCLKWPLLSGENPHTMDCEVYRRSVSSAQWQDRREPVICVIKSGNQEFCQRPHLGDSTDSTEKSRKFFKKNHKFNFTIGHNMLNCKRYTFFWSWQWVIHFFLNLFIWITRNDFK